MPVSSPIHDRPADIGTERADAATSLFPLPLAPFEWLHLLDDSPAYPATFFGDLTFAGEIDRRNLETAWALALARHPLLTARVDASQGGPCWVPAEPGASRLDIQPSSIAVIPDPGARIDLSVEPGLRLWARVGGNRTRLLFQFHHACCDGNGAMRLIADLLLAYAAETTQPGSLPGFDPLDRNLLLRRACFRPSTKTEHSAWRHVGMKLREASGFHTCRPELLAADEPGGEGELKNTAFPGIETRVLDEGQSHAVLAAVKRSGSTLNDAAVALALRTIADWNDRHGASGGSGWLRIIVPTDLRDRSDARMPAANRMSLYFLARRLSDCRDPGALLAGVQREMRYVKQTRLGLDFLHALGVVRRVPAVARAYLQWRRSLATAVLTNMADPTRLLRGKFPQDRGRLVIGNLVLEGITGSPPLRSGTRVALGIGKYAGRMILNARCDPRWFTAADTARFLDEHLAAWLEWTSR